MLCVALSESNPVKLLRSLKDLEMAEIRLDLMSLTDEGLQSVFKHPNLIATCRKNDKYDDKARQNLLLKAIDMGAAFVDVEIDGDNTVRKTVATHANNKGCKVILSYHNFEETPEYPELVDIVEQCMNECADVTKIATQVNDPIEAARLMSLYEHFHNIIALGMGEQGKITRVAATLLGAPFTFVSLDEASATAPGQIDIKTMKTILNNFKI